MMIREGQFAAIHYAGTLDDGQTFDSSFGGQPFEFQVGSGSVIPGLERAVIGMKVGDEKDVSMEPDEAYGEYDESLIHRVPKDEMKANFEPKEGMAISVMLENGAKVPAFIKEISNAEIVIDLNHPLAGKTLHFHIKVIDINDESKYSGSCSSGCDSCGSDCC
jgi:peptidylprolyl isomerase